jgi:hypothetical protein
MTRFRGRGRGQSIVLFALSLAAVMLVLGLAVDVGYAYSRDRGAQNAADLAAMAGTRIIGEELIGNSANGTALNVYNAIQAEMAANQSTLESAQYVDGTGSPIPGGDVVALGTSPDAGNYGTIPLLAMGVVVNASSSWHTFFLGGVGFPSWTARTTATTVTAGTSLGGGVLPVGLSTGEFGGLTQCPVTDLSSCIQQNLVTGSLNIPGGFAWLKFGATGACTGFGLGMDPTRGCGNSQPFLDSQIGPPADSFGCCTGVTGGPSDQIGSLPGNEWANLSYYVQHSIAIWVPIWDTAGGGGSGGSYHIVGFGAVIFTGQDTQHGRWLTGAAVSGVGCPGNGNTQVTGYAGSVCSAPGGAIALGATGSVRLIH